ncbi:MAG: hypothetical protein L3J02_04720 [Henriciella sp.]|nr:hypothetical protein [Henriciella sp.]
MFEDIVISIIRQAALLTKPQQDEFSTKAAETLATLINSTKTEIDDTLIRDVAIPIGGQIVRKLEALV